MRQKYRIEIKGKGEFYAAPGQTLAQAQEEQGVSLIPLGCSKGGCGTCKCRVIQGTVSHGHLNSIVCSPLEQEKGFILACQSEAKSDLVIVLP